MALQIWLPLTSDTRNNGVSPAIVTNYSATFSDGGKLGKCYSFSAGNYMKATNVSIPTTTWSIAAWVNLSITSADGHKYIVGLNTSSSSDFLAVLCAYTNKLGVRISDTTYNCTVTYTTNTWYHLAATYDGTLKIYVNGALDTTIASPVTPTAATTFYVGMRGGNTGYFAGKLNDVRVYDHVLSPIEVTEIAKGLCVHYKLDTPSSISNLVRNVGYNVYNNYASAGFTATLTNTGRTYNSCKIYRLTYTPGSDTTKLNNVKTALGNHGIYGFGRTFLANTKYCFWILCKPISHPDTVVGGTASNISGWTEIPMKKYSDDWFIVGQCRKGNVTENKTDSIYTSFKTPSAEAGVPITIDFCCPHLVEGSDSILPEYDYIGTNPGITDSSGYSNHGTKSGNISISSSTPRYSYSTKFDSGAHINVTLTTGGFGNTYTFSWWGKYSNYSSHMMWGFSNGNRLNLYMSGGNFYWNTGDGNNNPFNVSAATYGDNQWHHFAVTGDGTTAKLYIDGVFKANAKTYKGITGTTIYMNGWDSGTNYNFNGQLSDFRLYATCLSADDVLRLYNTAASVAKTGAMLGYEMKEG